MIENDDQLAQTRRILAETEAALLALRRRVAASNKALFEAMSEPYVADIARHRSEIDRYIGTAQAAEARAPLWVGLEGADLTAASVSTRLLAEWLDRLRKAVLNVSEYLQTGSLRSGGRPAAELIAVSDLRLVALAEGSIRVGIKLPPVFQQPDLFSQEMAGGSVARRAIERLLEMALWAQSDSVELPLESFPDRDEAAVIADQLSNLVPSVRGAVRVVSFSGSLSPSAASLKLRPQARPRLRGLIQILSVVSEEEVVGTIREIDLDAQRVILRERGEGNPDMRCSVPDALMPTVETLLDRVVRVRGQVSSATPFAIDVADIWPLENA